MRSDGSLRSDSRDRTSNCEMITNIIEKYGVLFEELEKLVVKSHLVSSTPHNIHQKCSEVMREKQFLLLLLYIFSYFLRYHSQN